MGVDGHTLINHPQGMIGDVKNMLFLCCVFCCFKTRFCFFVYFVLLLLASIDCHSTHDLTV